jgi:hypothetical protein
MEAPAHVPEKAASNLNAINKEPSRMFGTSRSLSAPHAETPSNAHSRHESSAKVPVVQRLAATTGGQDQHSSGDQLMTNMSRRTRVPRSCGDSGGLRDVDRFKIWTLHHSAVHAGPRW